MSKLRFFNESLQHGNFPFISESVSKDYPDKIIDPLIFHTVTVRDNAEGFARQEIIYTIIFVGLHSNNIELFGDDKSLTSLPGGE